MTTSLRWIVSSSASCFHAAEALASERPLADAALQAALQQPARDLAAAIASTGFPAPAFWSHLVPLSAGIAGNRELADVTLTKTIGRGQRQALLAPHFANLFTELENAFSAAHPDILEQLELRSAPLREQWDARGPGLLASIGRLTEPALLVEQADAILVHPALGGGGAAHLPYNSVRFEAVLANPVPQLPEVVRLAWLVAQLNCDLPDYQGDLHRERLGAVSCLALIPIALTAGEDVELSRGDEATLRLALDLWLGPGPSKQTAASTAQTLLDWHQVYRDTRPAWSIALAALDRMLTETTPP